MEPEGGDDPLLAFAHRAAFSDRRGYIDRLAPLVLTALGEAGVDAMVVKGMVVANWLYAPGEARGYVDCDLFVSPDALDAAGAVLGEKGMGCVRDQTRTPEAWTEPHEQVWRRGPAIVELHWRLPGIGADPAQAWALLWARHVEMTVGEATVPVLDPVARTVHLALHAAQHGDVELKPRVDVATAVERLDEETWRQAAVLAAELDATDAFSAGLRLDPRGAALADRLGVPEPSLRWTLLAAGAEEVGAERLLRWRQARGRERLHLTRVGLFPPREQMEMFFPGSSESRRALVAAHARRLVSLPARAVRGWLAIRRAP